MQIQTEEARGSSIAGNVFAIVLVALMSYLGFAAIQGEHGLFSLLRVEAEEARLKEELAGLQTERRIIANRTERLSDGSLDLDLLDEQARRVLSLGRPDEIILP